MLKVLNSVYQSYADPGFIFSDFHSQYLQPPGPQDAVKRSWQPRVGIMVIILLMAEIR